MGKVNVDHDLSWYLGSKRVFFLAFLFTILALPGLACSLFGGLEVGSSEGSVQPEVTLSSTSGGSVTTEPTMALGEASPVPTIVSGPVSGIAFVARARDIPGAGEEIFLIHPDGSGLRNLTQSRGDDRDPAWSPDGTKLAFSSKRDDNWEIYVMNADGTGQVRLTDDPAHDGEPCWSPDGQSLAFSSDREGGLDLYILHLDSMELIRLTDHPAQEYYPDWSPDGKKIAFSSFAGDREAGIYTIDVETLDITSLAWGPLHYPTWSPDGEKIAFDGEPHGSSFEIYIMDSDGSNMVQLTEHPLGAGGYNKEPSWAPDGTQIVFYSSERDPSQPHFELFIIHVDGTGETQITDSKSTEAYHGPFSADWSPVP